MSEIENKVQTEGIELQQNEVNNDIREIMSQNKLPRRQVVKRNGSQEQQLQTQQIRRQFLEAIHKLSSNDTRNIGMTLIKKIIQDNQKPKHMRIYLEGLSESKKVQKSVKLAEHEILVLAYICSVFQEKLLDSADSPLSIVKTSQRIIDLIISNFKFSNTQTQQTYSRTFITMYKSCLINQTWTQITQLLINPLLSCATGSQGMDEANLVAASVCMGDLILIFSQEQESCLFQNASQKFISVFLSLNHTWSFPAELFLCLNLIIIQTDKLPLEIIHKFQSISKKLCDFLSCTQHIQQAYKSNQYHKQEQICKALRIIGGFALDRALHFNQEEIAIILDSLKKKSSSIIPNIQSEAIKAIQKWILFIDYQQQQQGLYKLDLDKNDVNNQDDLNQNNDNEIQVNHNEIQNNDNEIQLDHNEVNDHKIITNYTKINENEINQNNQTDNTKNKIYAKDKNRINQNNNKINEPQSIFKEYEPQLPKLKSLRDQFKVRKQLQQDNKKDEMEIIQKQEQLNQNLFEQNQKKNKIIKNKSPQSKINRRLNHSPQVNQDLKQTIHNLRLQKEQKQKVLDQQFQYNDYNQLKSSDQKSQLTNQSQENLYQDKLNNNRFQDSLNNSKFINNSQEHFKECNSFSQQNQDQIIDHFSQKNQQQQSSQLEQCKEQFNNQNLNQFKELNDSLNSQQNSQETVKSSCNSNQQKKSFDQQQNSYENIKNNSIQQSLEQQNNFQENMINNSIEESLDQQKNTKEKITNISNEQTDSKDLQNNFQENMINNSNEQSLKQQKNSKENSIELTNSIEQSQNSKEILTNNSKDQNNQNNSLEEQNNLLKNFTLGKNKNDIQDIIMNKNDDLQNKQQDLSQTAKFNEPQNLDDRLKELSYETNSQSYSELNQFKSSITIDKDIVDNNGNEDLYIKNQIKDNKFDNQSTIQLIQTSESQKQFQDQLNNRISKTNQNQKELITNQINIHYNINNNECSNNLIKDQAQDDKSTNENKKNLNHQDNDNDLFEQNQINNGDQQLPQLQKLQQTQHTQKKIEMPPKNMDRNINDDDLFQENQINNGDQQLPQLQNLQQTQHTQKKIEMPPNNLDKNINDDDLFQENQINNGDQQLPLKNVLINDLFQKNHESNSEKQPPKQLLNSNNIVNDLKNVSNDELFDQECEINQGDQYAAQQQISNQKAEIKKNNGQKNQKMIQIQRDQQQPLIKLERQNPNSNLIPIDDQDIQDDNQFGQQEKQQFQKAQQHIQKKSNIKKQNQDEQNDQRLNSSNDQINIDQSQKTSEKETVKQNNHSDYKSQESLQYTSKEQNINYQKQNHTDPVNEILSTLTKILKDKDSNMQQKLNDQNNELKQLSTKLDSICDVINQNKSYNNSIVNTSSKNSQKPKKNNFIFDEPLNVISQQIQENSFLSNTMDFLDDSLQQSLDIVDVQQEIQNMIVNNQYQNAFQKALGAGDDFVLIRLLLEQNLNLKKLDLQSIQKIIQKTNQYMESQFIEKIAVSFFQQAQQLDLMDALSLQNQNDIQNFQNKYL